MPQHCWTAWRNNDSNVHELDHDGRWIHDLRVSAASVNKSSIASSHRPCAIVEPSGISLACRFKEQSLYHAFDTGAQLDIQCFAGTLLSQ
jgi:hypothetical protein